jgi:hypothetical protein
VWIPPINDLTGTFNNLELQIKKDEREKSDHRLAEDHRNDRYFYAWD